MIWRSDDLMIWWYDDMMIWWFDDLMVWWSDDLMIRWYDDTMMMMMMVMVMMMIMIMIWSWSDDDLMIWWYLYKDTWGMNLTLIEFVDTVTCFEDGMIGAHFSHRKQCEWNVKIRMLLTSPTLQEMGQPLHGGETTWKQRADGRWTDSFGSSNLIFRGEWIGFFGQTWWKYSKLMSHEIGFPSMSKKRCLFYHFFPWISLILKNADHECPGSRWSTHRVGDWLPLSCRGFRWQPFGYAPNVNPIVNHNRPQPKKSVFRFQKPKNWCVYDDFSWCFSSLITSFSCQCMSMTTLGRSRRLRGSSRDHWRLCG